MIAKKFIFKNIGMVCLTAISFVMLHANISQAANYIEDPSAYWRLEDATYADHVGSNDGICTFCPTTGSVSGIVNNYQTFDGADDGLRILPDSVFDWGANQSFSIELWVKRPATNIRDQNEVFIGRDEGLGDGVHWWVGLEGTDGADEGKVVFTLNDKTDAISIPDIMSDSSIADNQWHHVVAVRDNSNDENRLYIDGVLQQETESEDYDAGFDSATDSVDIGFLDINDPVLDAQFFFTGQLDEIAVYNVALTETQIMTHYLNGTAGKWLDEEFSPTILSTPEEAVAVGYMYDYDVDADGNPEPTYALSNEPDFMTIDEDTGEIDWVATDSQAGDHSFSVTASNTEGDSAPQNVTVSVHDLCDPTADEMKVYWKLEEAAPSYLDYFGNNDGGCVTCPTVGSADGIVGNYQTFNGTDTGIRVAADTVFDWGANQSFSIELWVKRPATNIRDQNEVLIGRDEGLGDGIHWWVGLEGTDGADEGKVVFTLNDKNDAIGVPEILSNSSIADNQWHHIVAVRDDVAGENILYVDGVLQDDVESEDYDVGFDSATDSLEIGFLDINDPVEDAQFFFTGQLDEIALYNIALPEEIVVQHYAQVRGRGYCNEPPNITTTAPTTVTEYEQYTYNPTATDPETDTVTWSLENEPTGMLINATSGAITWTPAEVATSGAVTLVANDGNGGTDTEVFTVAVSLQNLPPDITSTAPTTATEGVAYSYNPVAVDPDLPADTLVWSLTGAPSGMTINSSTGAISWTPDNNSPASATFTLTVDDQAGGTDEESITITVTLNNAAPVITSTAPTTATEGALYTYNPTATDADGDTLVWSLTSAPADMNIVVATGAITWTPAAGTPASVTFTLTVDDQKGATADEIITITVTGSGDDDDDDNGGSSSSGPCFIGSVY